jgi:hypothetical protein
MQKVPVKYKIPCQSISICAQYVTLDSKIKYLSLADFIFGNLTNVIETAYMWGLLIAKYLDSHYD